MSLHRSDIPDWEKVAQEDRSATQKVAAETNGWITPANVLTVGGLALTAWGTIDILRGKKERGVTKIAAGRSLDLLDGAVADYFKVKSPFGKSLDSGNDMIGEAAMVIGATYGFNMPRKVSLAFVLINGAESAVILANKHKWGELQPHRIGKYARFTENVTIGAYVIADLLNNRGYENCAKALRTIAHLGAAAAIASRTIAAIQLAIDATGEDLATQPTITT